MFSIYLASLVFGGTFTLLSAYGHFTDRSWSVIEKDGPLYTLRALVYSLVGFGGFGVWISRIDSGLGTGLELALSILAGLLVGGGASAGLAFLLRGRAETNDRGPDCAWRDPAVDGARVHESSRTTEDT